MNNPKILFYPDFGCFTLLLNQKP